jgi:hypothetical protein
MKRYCTAFYALCFAVTAPNLVSSEIFEFEGPENAPIYVLEGDFQQTASIAQNGGTLYYSTDISATMNVNTGQMESVGGFSVSGSQVVGGLSWFMEMDMLLSMKAVMKQAGNAVRWSGKAQMSGPMSFSSTQGDLDAFVTGTFNYTNVALDTQTGEQNGLMSFKATAWTSAGYKFPLNQPATPTFFPRPTVYSSEGEWQDAAGDWTAEITADVHPKGNIRGTGRLVVGDPSDPYANVAQSVSGKINAKSGVVSLSATGNTRSTSRVRVTLNYLDRTGETVAGKNSVAAYAQTRKY